MTTARRRQDDRTAGPGVRRGMETLSGALRKAGVSFDVSGGCGHHNAPCGDYGAYPCP